MPDNILHSEVRWFVHYHDPKLFAELGANWEWVDFPGNHQGDGNGYGFTNAREAEEAFMASDVYLRKRVKMKWRVVCSQTIVRLVSTYFA